MLISFGVYGLEVVLHLNVKEILRMYVYAQSLHAFPKAALIKISPLTKIGINDDALFILVI